MEVTRLGVKSASLCTPQSQQRWIPDILNEARDRTCLLMDTSQIHFHCATMGTPPFHPFHFTFLSSPSGNHQSALRICESLGFFFVFCFLDFTYNSSCFLTCFIFSESILLICKSDLPIMSFHLGRKNRNCVYADF